MAKAKSIHYPFINLERALLRVEQLYEKEGRNPANTKVAVQHWGYGKASSGGRQTVAALRAFGLIDASGEKNARSVQISELALLIIRDKREDKTELDEAIKTAATKPKIFNEMWGKWGQTGLPSDANIAHFLMFEKEINEASANKIIKIFKETISFAKLTKSDHATKEDEEIDEGDNTTEEVASKDTKRGPSLELPTQKTEMRQYSFSLDEGQVTIQLPKGLSKDSHEELRSLLGYMLHNAEIKDTGTAPTPNLTSGEQDVDDNY